MQDFSEEDQEPSFLERDFSIAKREILVRQKIASRVVENFIRTAPPRELEKLKRYFDQAIAKAEAEAED